MCEECYLQRLKVMEEIEQLVNCNGEAWDEITSMLSEEIFNADEDRKMALEETRVQGIAVRAALAAAYLTGSQHHNMPPAFILGHWAHNVLAASAEAERQIHLRNLFGMGDN